MPPTSELRAWHTSFNPASIAVSIYSAPAERRQVVSAAAVRARLAVHVDLILERGSHSADAHWEHVGVSFDELYDVVRMGGAVDVHLMVIGDTDASLDTALRETIHTVVQVKPRSLSLSAALMTRLGVMLPELRSRGVGLWLELGCREHVDVLEACEEAIDGALIMLIETGTLQQAQAHLLDKIPAIRSNTGPDFMIGVDGGVTREIAAQALGRGASIVVSGRALLG